MNEEKVNNAAESSSDVLKKSRGVLTRLAVLAVIVAIGAGFVVEQRTRPRLLSGPMVQIPEPGALTIVWQMDAPLGGGAVWLETSKDSNQVARATINGKISESGNAGRYEATFSGLPAGAEFDYRVVNERGLFGSTVLAGPYKTKTQPPRGTPFRFVAFGDSGNGSNTQADFARKIAASNPDLIIHVGDLVYPAGDGKTYRTHFYEPNAEMIRHAPFMPSEGNHDVATDEGRPLLEHFVCPRNGPEGIEPERCYWFDYGDARFVALDTNVTEFGGALTPDQLKTVVAPWVRRVFQDCDARWKFVFYHHPFYTGSEHSAEGSAFVKEAFLDAFEESGVDMVFCGHNHLYERTAPLMKDQIVEDGQGIVYIVTGAGGVSRYPEKLPNPAYIKYYNVDVFSYTRVDLTADRLELVQIDEHGNEIDRYTLNKPAPTQTAATSR